MSRGHLFGWNTGMAGERNQRWFVADEIVEDAGKESRVGSGRPEHLRTDTGEGQKTAQRLRFGGKPAKRVDSQQFRGVNR